MQCGSGGELNRHARVVAPTTSASSADRDACLATGMNDFPGKPIERPRLLEMPGVTSRG